MSLGQQKWIRNQHEPEKSFLQPCQSDCPVYMSKWFILTKSFTLNDKYEIFNENAIGVNKYMYVRRNTSFTYILKTYYYLQQCVRHCHAQPNPIHSAVSQINKDRDITKASHLCPYRAVIILAIAVANHSIHVELVGNGIGERSWYMIFDKCIHTFHDSDTLITIEWAHSQDIK